MTVLGLVLPLLLFVEPYYLILIVIKVSFPDATNATKPDLSLEHQLNLVY